MFFFRLSAQQNDLTSKKHVDKADFINNLRRAVNDDNHVCVCVFVCVSMFVYLFQHVCVFIVCIDVARADNLATGPHFVVICCDNLVTTCDTFRLLMYYAILLLKAPHRVNNI